MKIKYITFLLFFSIISNTQASMPFYDDDAEFDRCTLMNSDMNRCLSEETRRDLNDTKILYREILANPKLLNWNKNFEQNQQLLRDMYSSWTAFRNRLCSLSKVAARYTGGWKDEELSCNLYYTKHHKDHFQCINDMLKDRADERDDFIGDEHDEEYYTCIKTKTEDKCLLAEFQRSSEKIKDLYKKFYDSQFTSAWNNGTDLSNGNYRDMFDSWVAYRNRFCSLAAFGYQHFAQKSTVSKNHCLQYLNREKLETLENLYNLSRRAVNSDKAQKKSEDGGRTAGQAIPALEKRIESTESLTGSQKTEDKPVENIKTSEDKNNNLPAWARRK